MVAHGEGSAVFRTIAAYDAQAERYVQRTGDLAFYPGLAEELDEFKGMLDDGPLVDIGTGSGRDAFYLAREGRKVAALDLSERLLNHVAERLAGSTVYAMRGDLRYLPFRDLSLAGILCSGALLHIPRAEVSCALQGFHDSLRMGGVAMVSVKHGQGAQWYQNHELGPRRMEYYSEEELASVFTAAGFVIEKLYGPRRKDWITVVARRPLKAGFNC